jgi:2-oxoglutarate dehydrogenase E1 component
MMRAIASKKATSGSLLLRGSTSSACSACRRSHFLATSKTTTTKAIGARSNLQLTARRPLAVVDRVFAGRREYAQSAEETSRGVVRSLEVSN